MNISVNETTLSAVMKNDGNNEMKALLNEIVDSELEKEDMNTELVDECIAALVDLESENSIFRLSSYSELLKFCHSNAFAKRIRLRRAALIAAVAAISVSATLSASPTLAKQAKSVIESIIYSLGIAADSTDTGKNEIVSIYTVPKDDVNFVVQDEDEIHPEDVDIFAIDKSNFERHIPITQCTVKKEQLDSNRIMVIYSYEGCACSVIYKLEVIS